MPQTNLTLSEKPLSDKPPICLLDYHENKQNTILGDYGEQYIHNLLTQAQFDCEIVSHLNYCGDLQVFDKNCGERFAIEVKTAFIGTNGRFNFCLNKSNHTSIKYSDFVILLCIDKNLNHYIYVIHTSILNSKSITIASHPTKYKGKYSPFIQLKTVSFENARKVAELW